MKHLLLVVLIIGQEMLLFKARRKKEGYMIASGFRGSI